MQRARPSLLDEDDEERERKEDTAKWSRDALRAFTDGDQYAPPCKPLLHACHPLPIIHACMHPISDDDE
eukprot:3127359-Rhodomonas_salina.1